MGPAIECTTDAWWDAKERCIVTKADAELDDLMNQDVDLTFPEDEVTINLTQVQEVLQADIGMSMRSILLLIPWPHLNQGSS